MNREMKDSGQRWLGMIPKEWSVAYPKALFTQRKEKAVAGERQLTASQQYGVVYQDDYMEMTGSRVVIVQKDFDILKHVEAGDFVISMRSFQGGIEYSENTGCISSAYVMLKPNQDFVYDRYFKWLLKSSTYINALQSTSNLVRDGQAMRFTNFVQVSLPVVPLFEQEQIANMLDKKCSQIDALIANQQEEIEKLKQYKQSLITEVVTKGLDHNAPMKDSKLEWLGKVPEHWNLVATKRLFDILSGATPKSEVPEYWEGNIKWITPADYKTEDIYVNGGRRKLTEAGLNACSSSIVPKNSIIFSKRAPIGSVAINSDDLCTNQGCLACIPQRNISVLYYYYVMSICTEQYELLGSGTTFKEISATKFASFILPLPPLNEQKEVVEYLDYKCRKINELLQIKQQKIDKLNEYKKSIVYEYVTGKEEVV